MARIAFGAGLAVIWVLAWGTPSFANVVGGVLVATALIAVAPDPWAKDMPLRVRPVPVLRFVGYVLKEVVYANVMITRQVLARHPDISTGVVEVPMPPCSDGMLTLVTNVLAITPGTMPVEVETGENTRIFVHVLQLDDADDARREVQHLAQLAFRAFSSDESIAAMDALVSGGAR